MLATSAPFQVMVEGVQQTYHYKLGMTLPGGIYPDVSMTVSSVTTASQMTTDLPEGTRLLEGYPSATASFTLAGMLDKTDPTKTPAWLFNPYSLTSPLYRSDAFRSPVTIDLGLLPDGAVGVPELLRKFTGYVDSYTVNSDGSVDFTCIDLRSDLRNITSLPAVVTAPPYNAGLTSEFAVDALLRQSTSGKVSSWPAQRPSCILAAGLRSSLWPEVGALDTSSSFDTAPTKAPVFTAGAFGSAVTGRTLDLSQIITASYTTTTAIGTTVFLEAWVTGVYDGGGLAFLEFGAPSGGRVSVRVQSTGVSVVWPDGSSSPWPISVSNAPHYVAAAITLPAAGATGTASGTLYLDGASRTFTSGSFARSSTPWTSVSVKPSMYATVEAVQVTTETSPVINAAFSPRAVLDPSLNSLQVIPAVEGDPFQVIQQIAAAELGFAGFDESGVFRFYNRQRLRGGTSGRTISSTTSLIDMGVESTAASVVNRAQVGYTPWVFATVGSTVYSIDTVKKIPRKSSVPIIVNLETAIYAPNTSVVKLPNGSTNTAGSYYRASTNAGGTSEHPGPLSFTVVQTGSTTITITANNTSNVDAFLVSPSNYTDIPAGTPLLRIGGFLVTPDTELTADYQYPPVVDGGAASTRFGEVPFSMTGNPWLQVDDSANMLAQEIVAKSAQPIPNLTNVNILPDPRLQLADRVRISDPDVTGVDEYAQIFGLSTTLTENDEGTSDSSMTVDARTVARPGGWVLGVVKRSELGVTTWL